MIDGKIDSKCDAWEVFHRRSEKKSVLVERGRIKSVAGEIEQGYAVRVIVKGRIGFAFSQNLEEAFERAIKIARISGEELSDFPEGGWTDVKGIYNRGFEDITGEWLKESASRLILPCTDMNVNAASGSVEVERSTTSIKNSSGFEMEKKETSCVAFLEAVCDGSSAYEYVQSRNFNVDFDSVGAKAAQLALQSRNPLKLEKTCSVVLSPLALNQLLSYTLYQALSAESLLKGRSPLKPGDFLGEITIFDDATLDSGLNSMPFDDEGCKSTRKEVIHKGELKTFISDYRSSLLLKIEAGNSHRDELTSYPSITPTNMVIEYERSSDIENNSLVVHSVIGAHTANPVSGDFSVECMNAFYNGMPAKAMLYGNIYSALKKIECLGKKTKQVDFTVSPPVRFGEGAMHIV